MGLQTWPPSQLPLSSMACLDVETPSICRSKFKSVLQLCLQQRRTREQLVEQGIMPPLKTPAAFHEKIRSLERARTGNFLKHKLCSRPERSQLVRMHILQETQAEPSLQAAQMKLKRARLADDLNEKIAQRPGPMELVEKNILPFDSGVKEVINDDKANKTPDVYKFDEDSSDGLSPEQPANQEAPSSTSASPRESGGTEVTTTSSQLNTPIQHSPLPNLQPTSDLVNLVSTNEQPKNPPVSTPQPITTAVPSITPGPVLLKQSLPKLLCDKTRSKKSKEPKPRVKKLKYHQYIPPDQKQELSEVPMDSAYARLLQQQQQFLQLQILSQQQYNYQGVLPATLKPTTEAQTSCSSVLSGDVVSAPVQPRHTQTTRKLDHLPPNLDEMKVAELKMELKLRSLPVSGTKTDLIERLKLYQENSKIQTAAAASETTAVTAASQSENIKLTPPVSPIASKVSNLGIDDSSRADSPARLSDALSSAHTAPCLNSPQRASQEECPTETRPYEKDSEKDKRLHEKQRQIEELMRKLEQEQRLVEELKMQLEVEKRSQQGDSPNQLSPLPAIQVKEENMSPSNCSASCSSPGLPVLVKQEEAAADQSHLALPKQFIIGHQTITQPEALQSVRAGAQILLPGSLPASAVTIQLPTSGIKLHTTAVGSTASALMQTSGQVPQKIEATVALQQQCSTHNQPLTRTWRMDTTALGLHSTFPVSGCSAGASSNQAAHEGPMNESPCPSQPSLTLQQPKFMNHVSKCKDPPCYEDAVKQTRSMLTTVEGPVAANQQMDDLFDVLIESGEISPFIRQDPPSMDKPLPVTASVTTLPMNTVLSRPPPVVQVAQLRAAAMTSDPQLDTLLDSTLGTDTEPQTLKLMEELHSPIVTMEVDFNENTSPSALALPTTNIDNMDWLDLTLSVPAEGVNPLDMSTPVGVFSSDFLDTHELHLNWD
ncbi:myocardin-related transcription factor B isoform X2 [Mastacembelus armatus]|uniref:myocardin-related transcription factor B isoform X2 n=1 Tax=Mastacembelus armatus TaxID=205130 RepID=UPI000E46585A|nr:myocardin-related transcription factor B-like isoform X2 [Mastacembelus armatus]